MLAIIMMIKKTTMMIMAHLLVMGSDQPLSVLYCCRQYKQNEWPHRRSLGFSKTSKQMEQRIISFIDLSNNNDDKKTTMMIMAHLLVMMH